MCRITVNCHCHHHNHRSNHRAGGSGWIGVAALVALAFIAAPVIVAALKAAVDLLTALVIGLVAAAGVIVVGWIVKNIAVAAIEARADRRHIQHVTLRHVCGTALGETILLGPVPAGGDEGNRTPNPRLAKAVLCQLSYVPWLSGDVTRSAAGGIARAQLLVASCQRSFSREARTLEKMKAPAASATATAMSFFTRITS